MLGQVVVMTVWLSILGSKDWRCFSHLLQVYDDHNFYEYNILGSRDMSAKTKIGTGHLSCPSCKSDVWKSAKLVVLEGTSITQGNVSGKLTNPGAFSGGVRELLLSDRWFTWSQDINLEVGLTTTSGLVDEVKRLMVANSSLVKMPALPVEPKRIGIFEKIRPIEPNKPNLIEPIEPSDKPWSAHFLNSIKGTIAVAILVLIVVGLFSDFVNGTIAGIFVVLIGLPFDLIRSFWGNKREKTRYLEQVKNFPSAEKAHEIALEKYEKNLIKYELDCVAAEKQKQEESNAIEKHGVQLAEYEDLKMHALNLRALLWERARICTRCGTGYLGKA